jgi:hypothetical protein
MEVTISRGSEQAKYMQKIEGLRSGDTSAKVATSSRARGKTARPSEVAKHEPCLFRPWMAHSGSLECESLVIAYGAHREASVEDLEDCRADSVESTVTSRWLQVAQLGASMFNHNEATAPKGEAADPLAEVLLSPCRVHPLSSESRMLLPVRCGASNCDEPLFQVKVGIRVQLDQLWALMCAGLCSERERDVVSNLYVLHETLRKGFHS